MKIDFMALSPTDFERISKMVNEIYDHHLNSLNSEEGANTFRKIMNANSLILKQEEGYILRKIMLDKEIVGFLGIEGFHVRYLFIQTEFQKLGIGSLAINWVKDYLSSNHISDIITLFSSPNAVEAYEKMGFRKTGEEFSIRGIRAIPYQLTIIK